MFQRTLHRLKVLITNNQQKLSAKQSHHLSKWNIHHKFVLSSLSTKQERFNIHTSLRNTMYRDPLRCTMMISDGLWVKLFIASITSRIRQSQICQKVKPYSMNKLFLALLRADLGKRTEVKCSRKIQSRVKQGVASVRIHSLHQCPLCTDLGPRNNQRE